MSEALGVQSVPKLSRVAVVSLGVTAMLASFVVLPTLPIVVVAVCRWWLDDDLMRDPSRRPGWLGWIAFGAFTIVAVLAVGSALLLDVHFDCGGTLGGYGESASARLDEACVGAERWRPVLGVILTLTVVMVGVSRVRRSSASASPDKVASATFGILTAAVIAITVVLFII